MRVIPGNGAALLPTLVAQDIRLGPGSPVTGPCDPPVVGALGASLPEL